MASQRKFRIQFLRRRGKGSKTANCRPCYISSPFFSWSMKMIWTPISWALAVYIQALCSALCTHYSVITTSVAVQRNRGSEMWHNYSTRQTQYSKQGLFSKPLNSYSAINKHTSFHSSSVHLISVYVNLLGSRKRARFLWVTQITGIACVPAVGLICFLLGAFN